MFLSSVPPSRIHNKLIFWRRTKERHSKDSDDIDAGSGYVVDELQKTQTDNDDTEPTHLKVGRFRKRFTILTLSRTSKI